LHRSPQTITLLLISLAIFGCAGPRATEPGASAPPSAAAPKRIVAAIAGSLTHVYDPPNFTDRPRGVQEVTTMVHASLTVFDTTGQLHPQLAESVPTVDNGLWKLLPDGSMETSWKIRQGAEWHDGAPFTADDLIFAYQVSSDPELPVLRDPSFSSIQSIEAPDPLTVVVRWKGPFIRADQLFSDRIAIPMPKHILALYADGDKANFLNLPYWGAEFVGLGPYKVKDFQPGVHVLVQANDRYVLGRPRIDEIDVQTIADSNAIVANLLAGSVDVVLGRALSVDQAVILRDGWPEGKILLPLVSLQSANAQLLDPTPPIMLNVQFRRAVLESIDRQQLADSIEYGLLPPADTVLDPNSELAKATAAGIVKYPYDPRQAGQLIEELGYAKASDGFYRDVGGQQLRLEIRASAGDINPKTMFAIADYMQRLGIAVDSTVIPLQLSTNSEYRATFPAFAVAGTPLSDRQIERFTSASAPVAETRFTGDNKSRYMDPEMDALTAKYQVTIPIQARMDVATQMIRNVTTNLPILPLYYDSFPGVRMARLTNAEAAAGGGSADWNVADWDLQPGQS
jgi:peptide/nickel transport system substrate-binding protein